MEAIPLSISGEFSFAGPSEGPEAGGFAPASPEGASSAAELFPTGDELVSFDETSWFLKMAISLLARLLGAFLLGPLHL